MKTEIKNAIDDIGEVVNGSLEFVQKFSNSKVGFIVLLGLIWKFFGKEVYQEVFVPLFSKIFKWIKIISLLLIVNWLIGFKELFSGLKDFFCNIFNILSANSKFSEGLGVILGLSGVALLFILTVSALIWIIERSSNSNWD